MTDTLNYDKKTVPGTAGLIVSVISYTLSRNPLYNNSKKIYTPLWCVKSYLNYTPLWCVIFCAILYFDFFHGIFKINYSSIVCSVGFIPVLIEVHIEIRIDCRMKKWKMYILYDKYNHLI